MYPALPCVRIALTSYLHHVKKLDVILGGMWVGTFLAALDGTIVATVRSVSSTVQRAPLTLISDACRFCLLSVLSSVEVTKLRGLVALIYLRARLSSLSSTSDSLLSPNIFPNENIWLSFAAAGSAISLAARQLPSLPPSFSWSAR